MPCRFDCFYFNVGKRENLAVFKSYVGGSIRKVVNPHRKRKVRFIRQHFVVVFPYVRFHALFLKIFHKFGVVEVSVRYD